MTVTDRLDGSIITFGGNPRAEPCCPRPPWRDPRRDIVILNKRQFEAALSNSSTALVGLLLCCAETCRSFMLAEPLQCLPFLSRLPFSTCLYLDSKVGGGGVMTNPAERAHGRQLKVCHSASPSRLAATSGPLRQKMVGRVLLLGEQCRSRLPLCTRLKLFHLK